LKAKNYRLNLLLGSPLKARYLHITAAIGGIFESKEFYIGRPFESKVLIHFICCWGPL